MTARSYVLSETNWKTVRETAYEAVILPWGATEAHNLHLPFGTDTLQAEAIATEAAAAFFEAPTQRMKSFLVDLIATDLDALYA